MPETMEAPSPRPRLSTPRAPISALLLALCALLFGRELPAQEKARLIVTANIASLYPQQATNPPVADAAKKFEEELRRRKQENPDALFVQAANHHSITNSLETSYNMDSCRLFSELDYAVVNLNARDAALGIVPPGGYQYAPAKYLAPVISNLEPTTPSNVHPPLARHVANGKALPITFVSLGSVKEASGLSGKVSMLQEAGREKIAAAITNAREQKDVVVGFNSHDAADYTTLFPSGADAPDVLIELRGAESGSVSRAGKTWKIGAPAGGQFLVVDLEKDASGAIVEPKVERVELLTPAEYWAMIDYFVPQVGVPIPNVEHVRSQFFPDAEKATREDRLDPEGLSSITAWRKPSVYHLRMNGEEYRLYRVMSTKMVATRPGVQDPGWPNMDMLVLVGTDHLVERVNSRIQFPVGTMDTTLAEALGALRGQEPQDWRPHPVYAAGIEEMWGWGTYVLRKVIELDKATYGEGGRLRRGE
jgi:hypothetical protein